MHRKIIDITEKPRPIVVTPDIYPATLLDRYYQGVPTEIFPAEPVTLVLRFSGPATQIALRYENETQEKSLPFQPLPGNPDTYVAIVKDLTPGSMTFWGTITQADRIMETGHRHVTVRVPIESWQERPIAKQVYPNVYVGNARAAYDLGLQGYANLTTSDQFDFSASNPNYKKVDMTDLGMNVISKKALIESLIWILEQLAHQEKIIINCRAGMGRSGSTAVALIYLLDPTLNFSMAVHKARYGDTQEETEGKPDIFPHTHLRNTLRELSDEMTAGQHPELLDAIARHLQISQEVLGVLYSKRPANTVIQQINLIAPKEPGELVLAPEQGYILKAQAYYSGADPAHLFLYFGNKAIDNDIHQRKLDMSQQGPGATLGQIDLAFLKTPGQYWVTLFGADYDENPPLHPGEVKWLEKDITVHIRH